MIKMLMTERQRLNGNETSDDTVRRAAYECAINTLGGRRAATANLSDEDLRTLAETPCAESVGRPDLPGSSR